MAAKTDTTHAIRGRQPLITELPQPSARARHNDKPYLPKCCSSHSGRDLAEAGVGERAKRKGSYGSTGAGRARSPAHTHLLRLHLPAISSLSAASFMGTANEGPLPTRCGGQRCVTSVLALERWVTRDTPTAMAVPRQASRINGRAPAPDRVERIAALSGAGDYVEVHLLDGRKMLHSGSLATLEKELPTTFLRVHRSHIVDLEQITELLRHPSWVGELH